MKKLLLFLLIFFVIIKINIVFSQPEIEWSECIGSEAYEAVWHMSETADGNYILAGNRDNSFWILKVDSIGNTIWSKIIGGTSFDRAQHIRQTHDMGYIVCGESKSNNGDVSGHHGPAGLNYDFWVVKLDSIGNIIWERSLGGTEDDGPYSVCETYDGGYIVVGYSKSDDGDVSTNYGNQDYWVVKLNYQGDIIWEKSYGTDASDYAKSIINTFDGGYYIFGYDLQDFHGIKIDNEGNVIWEKFYGGSSLEQASQAIQTVDNGYLMIGDTQSDNGDVNGHHGGQDVWVVKTDSLGNIIWTRCFGGSNGDSGYDIIETLEGDYVLTGISASSDGNLSSNNGWFDVWIVKINASGSILWEKSVGGSEGDYAYSILEPNSGEYLVAGITSSSDFDVLDHNGGNDAWLVKFSTHTISGNNTNDNLELFPNPVTDKLNIATDHNRYTTAKVYNAIGLLVLTKDISLEKHISFDTLEKGFYFVYLTDEMNTVIKKVIKQ